MMELLAYDVEFVPPLATERVPVIVESVLVATHVGTPETKAKVKPFVPCEVVAKAAVPLPRRSVLDWTLAQPVPPDVTASADAKVKTPALEKVEVAVPPK